MQVPLPEDAEREAKKSLSFERESLTITRLHHDDHIYVCVCSHYIFHLCNVFHITQESA